MPFDLLRWIYSSQEQKLLTLMSALGLMALLGCTPMVSAPPATPTPKVTVTPAITQETVDFNDFTGTVQASEKVDIRTRVSGYLLDIKFKDGDLVEVGDELFKIEPDEYQAIYDQSTSRIAIVEASLELADAKHARNVTLVKSGAVSREEFDETAAAVKVAQAQLISAKADAERSALDLKYTSILSPISGRIDRTLVTRGNFVTSGLTGGAHLTTIVKEQPTFVYFDVDEATLLSYRKFRRDKHPEGAADGDRPGSLLSLQIPCYVQLGDEKDYPHVGMLDFASNQSDEGTGTITIRAVFKNQDRVLTSGLFVRVRVPTSDPYQALMIPETALALDQSERYVYVVGSDGVAQRRNVEVGTRRGGWRIVTSGLEPGERVIVKGLQRVRPGEPVETEDAKDLKPPTLSVLPAVPEGETDATMEPVPAPKDPTAPPVEPTTPPTEPAAPAEAGTAEEK